MSATEIETAEARAARLAWIEVAIVAGCKKHVAGGGVLGTRSRLCALRVAVPSGDGFGYAGRALGMLEGEPAAFTVGFDSVDGIGCSFPYEAKAHPDLVAMGRRIAEWFGVMG